MRELITATYYLIENFGIGDDVENAWIHEDYEAVIHELAHYRTLWFSGPLCANGSELIAETIKTLSGDEADDNEAETIAVELTVFDMLGIALSDEQLTELFKFANANMAHVQHSINGWLSQRVTSLLGEDRICDTAIRVVLDLEAAYQAST